VDSQIVYLYAVGGRSPGGPLASYEALPIAVDPDGSQTVGTWSAGATPLPLARWQLGAYAVDEAVTTAVAEDESWIYVGSGLEAGGAVAAAVDAAMVLPGGALTPWAKGAKSGFKRAGYGALAASGQLYAIGGANGAPSTSMDSGLICGVGSCSPSGTVNNFNSTGSAMSTARVLMGAVTGSGHVFLAGGLTPMGVTSSVETTVW
jgi:hypothetical protein